ncbi:ACT domain-containing protein, partial [Streptococcus pneumoniae]
MELVALDKAGLLAQVSQIFSELNLNLLNAKITTVGEKAEDFFILTNQFGQALDSQQREILRNV